jgi:peptide chain release factor 1
MTQTEEFLKAELEIISNHLKENEAIIASPEADPELKALAQEELITLIQQKTALENSVNSLATDFSSSDSTSETKGDPADAIDVNMTNIEIRAGTGGDEAGLFARDLYRMYQRYGEKNNWKFTEIFSSENEAGGLKTIMSEIRGKNVYNLLKNEAGVHRVQRVPVTESGGRIHTSTATIAVLPILKKVFIEIKPVDLKWDFFRSGGKGGQNVNKVSTAVRLTHIPTGLIVECQEERFQGKNRDKALQILNSRLFSMMQEQQVKSVTDIRSAMVGTGDRTEKIRTYNYPQSRVTDHRINESWHNIEQIMEGNIGAILDTCSKIGQNDKSESESYQPTLTTNKLKPKTIKTP